MQGVQKGSAMGSLCECRRLSVLDWRGVFAQKRRADLEEDWALVF
jgi:hypothetical protein